MTDADTVFLSASCRGQGAGVLAEPENDAYLHRPVERVCHAADACVSNEPTQKVFVMLLMLV